MSRLVRLYPKAWRDRYEEEFLTLLAERPPTFVDLLDTVRGAIDAHLNPQAQAEPFPLRLAWVPSRQTSRGSWAYSCRMAWPGSLSA